ncbi:MAG TPA: Wadjet anti-phage system protein JetD domain-containing protein [Puia sp.]|uniref:Wadjet anti-phage system protein JetD domain-containing protein n=1 Tax=Puia sp. TaxID=2045100 RepID=UPI002C18C490|nr:Wadjet anti-phage system protein JetD domain-containing protein [Puia sp.]HVU97201.1 Wadjet anti-phage system protein JetD domain-containing protein [Puia sp.]
MNDLIFIRQLENKYPDYLRSIIRGESFVPIRLRGEKQKPGTTEELHKFTGFFRAREKTAERPGWTIDWKPWNTKKFGNQIWPDNISVHTEEDYLHLLNKNAELHSYRSILEELLQWEPLVRDWLAENPLLVLKQKENWKGIRATVDFFLHHDLSAYYIRSIPIPVHTKFVEQNKPVIHSLLAFLDPQRFPKDGRDLEEVASLLQLPHLYPVRWLDPQLSSLYTVGLDILALPYQQLIKSRWSIKEIWVVENETNLYLLPPRTGALAIFAKGKALHNLKDIPFFASARIFYWGDLDEDGYEMLDSFRRYYNNTESILMDEKTVLYHQAFLHTIPFRHNRNFENFTPEENAAYRYLWSVQGRIEQEKLEQLFVQQYIKEKT